MPKNAVAKDVKQHKSANSLEVLFKTYKVANGFTCEELGKQLGKSREQVTRILNKRIETWTIKEMSELASILEVPMEAMSKAVLKAIYEEVNYGL